MLNEKENGVLNLDSTERKCLFQSCNVLRL